MCGSLPVTQHRSIILHAWQGTSKYLINSDHPTNHPKYIQPYTSSTAQGGGGSFKNRKPIGKVGCCESRMAERSHWWIERWLMSPLFLSLSLSFSLFLSLSPTIYLPTYLSIYLSLSLSFFHLSICLAVYLSIYPSIYLSVYLSTCLSIYLSNYLSIYLSPLRKSAPWPPNISHEHVFCTAPATKMHLCRSSSNVPCLPSFLEMLQNPHGLVTFDKVHNALRLPCETTSEPPKMVRTWCVLCILTWKCASRHNGVHFFDISNAKSGPHP